VDEQRNHLPEVFELSVGGFLGESFSVRLDGTDLIYERAGEGYQAASGERLRPDEEEWERFWRALEVIDPWAWNGSYDLPPERTVTDGSHWSVHLSWLGQCVEASGLNAYPPYSEGPETSPHWDLFCEAVERLIGRPFA
jgi:hypothetical protein